MTTNITTGSSGYSGDWKDSNAHGSARWMSPQEADELKLNSYLPNSILLGKNSQGQLCFYNDQGHIIVLAPPRSGKGIGFVQPNLIAYQGSMVVTDPKGENCGVSYLHRLKNLNQNVVVLDPTQKLKSYGITPSIPTHRFNPLALLDTTNAAQSLDDIDLVTDALLVSKEGEKEQHWRDGARQVLGGVLTFLIFFMPKSEHNLVMLSKLANGLEAPLDDIFAALVHNGHPDPMIAEVIARKGAAWDKVNPKERASFISIMLRSLAWLNSPVWHDHLKQSDFQPDDLKAGKTTVFIVCTFDKLEQFAPWFRLVMTNCILAVIRAPNRSPIPTLFLLDEYAATIGKLAVLEQSIPFIEGVGGRYAMIFQNLSQMTALWPDDDYHGKFSSAGVHLFFNVNDQKTADYASRYIGNYSAKSPGPNGPSFVQRPLVTPDEVLTFPATDLIAFIRGYRPAWLGKINVRADPTFKDRLLPNPAYFVLPEKPKALRTGQEPLLNAASAIARATMQGKELPELTMPRVVAMLDAKYPGKKMRIVGDMCGYDDTPRFNPETGLKEPVFVPIMSASFLAMLGKGESA